MLNRTGQVWIMNQIGKNIFLIVGNPRKTHSEDHWWYHPVKWLMVSNSSYTVILPNEITEGELTSLDSDPWKKRIV